MPVDVMPLDAGTGLLAERAMRDEIEREVVRSARGGAPCTLACVSNAELGVLRERFGARAEEQLARQLAAILRHQVDDLDLIGRDRAGRFMILLPETDARGARRRLQQLSAAIVEARLEASGTPIRLTPTVGFAVSEDRVAPEELFRRAVTAAEHAAAHLDLMPVRHDPRMDAVTAPKGPGRIRIALERGRVPFQIALTQVAGVLLPFVAYIVTASLGFELADIMYVVVVVALLMTSVLIWAEGFAALRRTEPPQEPGAPPPPASAIIAAYLPNEAATVRETVEAFLQVDYPAGLQVILAYNTPKRCRSRRSSERSRLVTRASSPTGSWAAPPRRRTSTRRSPRSQVTSSASSTPTTSRTPAAMPAPGAGCPTATTSSRGTASFATATSRGWPGPLRWSSSRSTR
jgi:GGDEF domain-containing protein